MTTSISTYNKQSLIVSTLITFQDISLCLDRIGWDDNSTKHQIHCSLDILEAFDVIEQICVNRLEGIKQGDNNEFLFNSLKKQLQETLSLVFTPYETRFSPIFIASFESLIECMVDMLAAINDYEEGKSAIVSIIKTTKQKISNQDTIEIPLDLARAQIYNFRKNTNRNH